MKPTNNLEEYFLIISKKLFIKLARQVNMSTSSPQITTKLLEFHAYKLTVVHKLYHTDHKVRLKFV